MEVQSGILANVQYSPSGWQLVPLFFFKSSLYPFLRNSSASWVSGTFKEGAIGCLLAHCIAHPCGTPALVAEGGTWPPTLCPVGTRCPAVLLSAAFPSMCLISC